MNSCIFCKIIAGEKPAQIVYQDEQVTAFRDIRPVAPTHVLIVPNHHFDSINDLNEADENLAGHLLTIARQIAKEEGVDEDGYRLIINTGVDGGQTVFHMHVHLIGGRRMPFLIG
jgi:histidine triad (HIT) family protein